MSIVSAFARARTERRAAFIPYITAGDPDLAATERLAVALAAAGADILELGVPFSDPIADGPVNQAAAARALASGTTLVGILALVARLRPSRPVHLLQSAARLWRRALRRARRGFGCRRHSLRRSAP